MTVTYQWLRMNGDVFVAISLAGCLLVRDWPLGTLLMFLSLIFVSSGFLSIWHSIANYNTRFFATKRGIYYNAKIVCTLVIIFLGTYYYNLSVLEIPLKSLLVAYIIILNIDRYRWSCLAYGVSAGAVLALAYGLVQIEILGIERAAGETNAIRFGMMAVWWAQ